MNLAFYYHIPIISRGDELYMPGYLGVFIDSLASSVTKLYLVMHEANKSQLLDCDYRLNQHNIQWINLGLRAPAWSRTFFPGRFLKVKMKEINNCDAFIVRSPSPLAPHFYKYVRAPKIYFMIVGSYVDDSHHLKSSTWRNRIIYYYLHYYDKQFIKRITQTDILINSPSLYQKYKDFAKSIRQIRTTTLSDKDFYLRDDTCNKDSIKLLYTGRIDPAKGLTELVNAVAKLRNIGKNVFLDLVGWEDVESKPYETELISLATERGILKYITFHGKKQIGDELNAMYREADIYIIPSYYEGFPRTIWEAMANSLPVIASRVGGIPETLSENLNVLLIEPKNIDQIVDAVVKMVTDISYRQSLIKEGQKVAKENTLELQTRKIIEYIKEDQINIT